jgi:hypothetical protein
MRTATRTKKIREASSSSVNAFWKAASCSASDCWMYLSAMPRSFRNASVTMIPITSPQTPNCSRVRNAAMITRWSPPSPLSPMLNAELMSVPRAVCVRRLGTRRPSRAVISSCPPGVCSLVDTSGTVPDP